MEKSRFGTLTDEPVLPLIVRVTRASGVSSGYRKASRLSTDRRLNDSLPWGAIERLRFIARLQVAENLHG